jgi:hypothetical protein
VGREVRGIAEFQHGAYYQQGKVTKVAASGEITWMPEHRCIPWKSHPDDVELLPALKFKTRAKTGKISGADLEEIKIRIPDLKTMLMDCAQLEDIHIVLGSWMIYRDLLRDSPQVIDGVPVMPYLVQPHVVHAYLKWDSEEVRVNSSKALCGMWKRHGLLGLPVNDAGHWTLLVLRRSREVNKIRYYDSLQDHMQKNCKKGAEELLKLLVPDAEFPERRNKTTQLDSISCGLYVLHYWEGEHQMKINEHFKAPPMPPTPTPGVH